MNCHSLNPVDHYKQFICKVKFWSIISQNQFSIKAKKQKQIIVTFSILKLKKILRTEERESIQQDIYDDNIKTFEHNRKIGENGNYICELIRQDSIETNTLTKIRW